MTVGVKSPPGTDRARRAKQLVAVVSVLALFACSSDSATVRFVDEILQERAEHLTGGDRRDVAIALVRTEKRTGVDAMFLLAVMEEESHYRVRARSRRGALGLLQVRPATGRDVAERNRIPWDGRETLFEPAVNILIGGTYLSELEERFGSRDLALTAYNHGPTKAKKAASRGRTPSSRYAARVLRRFEALSEMSEQ